MPTNNPQLDSLLAAIGTNNVADAHALLSATPDLAASWKPINEAAYLGRVEIVGLLADAGADISSASPSGFTPLHRAIEPKDSVPRHDGHLAVVRLLVARGADLTVRGSWHHSTSLLTSTMAGEPAVVAVLTAATFREREADIFEASALGWASRVEYLLHEDASLAAAQDSNTMTPLHYCAASQLWRGSDDSAVGLLRCAQLLLDAGALHSAIASLEGHSLPPLHWAPKSPVIARLLVENGANPTDGLGSAMWEEAWDLAEFLLAHGADVNAREGARTILHERLHWGKTKPAQWLLSHGADPTLAASDGTTPLHAAVGRGLAAPTLAALAEAGADLYARDNAGNTPYDTAVQRNRAKAAAWLAGRMAG
ncbi:MAG TPA: ankyrin repeat domain-containing protein [Capsulimonadaceae bacterium]|jgi:ankyrin repeat protein